MGNPSHNALSAIARMTPPIFFSDACLRPCSTGRGSTDPGRPWLHHYPILSLTGFLQSQKIKFPEKEEGYPGRTPLRLHRPRIPVSFVIPGSLPWVSRLLPGFRRSPADLHGTMNRYLLQRQNVCRFFFSRLTVSGLICLYSPFSPEHSISLPSPDYWPCKPGN
jgi:hypothetical protein